MTTAIGSNPYGAVGTAYGSQTTATTATATATAKTADAATGTAASADSVDLSDAAKAYLASQSTDAASLATAAREWFDAQYKTTGLASPMLDGSVALDMTSISRETLSAVAANTGNQFSQDEILAAGATLQKRFDDALAPHVVVARHTGDYAGLYKAAADYLDKAGADERATPLWTSTRQAVDEGLALARQSPMKAPQTTNGNDPVAALLQKTTQVADASGTTSDAAAAADARARFDALANKARDAGTQLVFDPSRKTGQFVDFSSFSNQSLAVVTLNTDGQFSAEEQRAAKSELSQRHRTSLMSVFDGSNGAADAGAQSLALIRHYNSMTAAEKAATGYNSDLQNRLVQNYRLASMFGGGSATSSNGNAMSLLNYMN